MTGKKPDPKPTPVKLTAGEALRLSGAYQAVEYAERAYKGVREDLMVILQGIFASRKLPKDFPSKPWFINVDGDDVQLVPPEKGNNASS